MSVDCVRCGLSFRDDHATEVVRFHNQTRFECALHWTREQKDQWADHLLNKADWEKRREDAA